MKSAHLVILKTALFAGFRIYALPNTIVPEKF